VYGCSLSLSASIDEVNDSAAQASMDEVIDSACGKDTVRLIEACGFDCCFAADNFLWLPVTSFDNKREAKTAKTPRYEAHHTDTVALLILQ
jgi:hypothetical protein